MSMTLQTSGNPGLDPVVARVLERVGSEAGLSGANVERLVRVASDAVEQARVGAADRRVRLHFAWASDDIEIVVEGLVDRGAADVGTWEGAELLLDEGFDGGGRLRLSRRTADPCPRDDRARPDGQA